MVPAQRFPLPALLDPSYSGPVASRWQIDLGRFDKQMKMVTHSETSEPLVVVIVLVIDNAVDYEDDDEDEDERSF